MSATTTNGNGEKKQRGNGARYSQQSGAILPDRFRQLPHSSDAEKGIVGSMMIGGPEVIETAAAMLTVEHFHVPALGTIFHTILAMHQARMPIDFITVTQTLSDQGVLEQVGGPAFVTDMFMFVPTAANAEFYANTVAEKFILRCLITECTKFAARAYDEQEAPHTLLEEAQQALIEIGAREDDASALRHIARDMLEGVDRIEARYRTRGKLDGLSTGFTDLDRMLDGLKGACVYVLAGRPAMGKSALGMAVAMFVALDNLARLTAGETIERPGVAIFSVEMTRQKIVDRLFATHAEVTREKIRRGFLSARDFERMAKTVELFTKAHLYVDASSVLTCAKFRSAARRAVIRHKCGIIIIDHVQHMKGSSKASRENRALELKEIMETIAETAKLLGVPVIALAQLSRGAEERRDSKPTMADLKESGAIEEYADMVGLLWRPDYYCKTDQDREHMAERLKITTEDLETYVELDVAKQRDGATGPVVLRFVGEFVRFENPDAKPLYSNNPELRQQNQ